MVANQLFRIFTPPNPTTMSETKTYPCETCRLRAHYDRNPKSLIGRFWRWHINFCPGWKEYFTHQDPEVQAGLRERYGFEKYR